MNGSSENERILVSQFTRSSNATTGDVTLVFNESLKNNGSLFENMCTFKVQILEDVNVEGKVDMQDVASAANAFGSSDRTAKLEIHTRRERGQLHRSRAGKTYT